MSDSSQTPAPLSVAGLVFCALLLKVLRSVAEYYVFCCWMFCVLLLDVLCPLVKCFVTSYFVFSCWMFCDLLLDVLCPVVGGFVFCCCHSDFSALVCHLFFVGMFESLTF